MFNLQDLEVGQYFRYYVDCKFGLSPYVYEVIEHRDSYAYCRPVYYFDSNFVLHSFDTPKKEEAFFYDVFIVFLFPHVN